MSANIKDIFLKDILAGLVKRGHKIVKQDAFGSVVVGIQMDEEGDITANSDFRKSGSVDGFWYYPTNLQMRDQ